MNRVRSFPLMTAITLTLLCLACRADGIAWQELDAQAQELLAPLEPEWKKLPAERRERLGERLIVSRLALRNALVPVLTIIGLQLSFLLAGAIIIENVFFLPGLGRLIFQGITQRDLLVVESVVMLLVFAVILVTFLVDLAYAAVDPRLRRR